VTGRLNALTHAFENFLAYEPCPNHGPYINIKGTRHNYNGASRLIDSLVNNPNAFTKCMERLWMGLCPTDNPLRDVLDRGEVAADLDTQLAALMVNIAFSGADLHFKNVLDRRTKYKQHITNEVSAASAVPVEAAKSAASGSAASAATAPIQNVADILIQHFSSKLVELRTKANFTEMRQQYATLFAAVSQENSLSGAFVVSQQVLTPAEMRSLLPSARGVPFSKIDSNSREGQPASIRERWERKYEGDEKIANYEYELITSTS
jgi:hypothetical protein